MSDMTRRRALKTLFCSSAVLGLNLTPRRSFAAEGDSPSDRHFLIVGDTGSLDKSQEAVAAGMIRYAQSRSLKTEGLWFLGDNFYQELKGLENSPLWKTGFEDMYPASAFPGPCWSMLGNHDYADTVDGDLAQLNYAKKPGTRWKMPAKWYRVDWPVAKPLVTLLVLDTNWRVINEPAHKSLAGKRKPWWLSEEEEKTQHAWLKSELAKPRKAPFVICAGHHPVYTNSVVGDTKPLVEKWAPIFQEHNVDLYLCGHDHDLQHLELEGRKTSYVVSGAGGARLTGIKDKSSRSIPFAKAVYGFSHLQVNDQRFLLRHLDANGQQLHAFTKTVDGKVAVM
ncbi:MAG TPA: metallophosphoesterase [Verrucomicrobiales bacterium]|nr:metallophosphoesterase [Verrucomicrobiales bacterium]